MKHTASFCLATIILVFCGQLNAQQDVAEMFDDDNLSQTRFAIKTDFHDIFQGEIPLLVELPISPQVSAQAGLGYVYGYRPDIVSSMLDGFILEDLDESIRGLGWQASLRWYPHQGEYFRQMEGWYYSLLLHQRRLSGISGPGSPTNRERARLTEISPRMGLQLGLGKKFLLDLNYGFGVLLLNNDNGGRAFSLILPIGIKLGFRQ